MPSFIEYTRERQFLNLLQSRSLSNTLPLNDHPDEDFSERSNKIERIRVTTKECIECVREKDSNQIPYESEGAPKNFQDLYSSINKSGLNDIFSKKSSMPFQEYARRKMS